VHRLIGTPDYTAPEIIQGISYENSTVDWWSLGVLMFEFLVGIPPFNDTSVKAVYDNILNLRIPWEDIPIGYEPESVTPEAKDLIDKLLVLDQTKRLGANGAEEIMNHRYFKGVDWVNLKSKPAPIIPEKKNASDTSNFTRIQQVTDKDKLEPFPMYSRKGSLNEDSELQDLEMVRYDILDSENQKTADAAVKHHEEEIKKQFQKEETLATYNSLPDSEDMSPPACSLFDVPMGFEDVLDTPKRSGSPSPSRRLKQFEFIKEFSAFE